MSESVSIAALLPWLLLATSSYDDVDRVWRAGAPSAYSMAHGSKPMPTWVRVVALIYGRVCYAACYARIRPYGYGGIICSPYKKKMHDGGRSSPAAKPKYYYTVFVAKVYNNFKINR